MVKKISGSTGKPGGATPIQGSKTIESAKIGGVSQVKEAEGKSGVSGVRREQLQITPDMKEQLLQLIDEEAEKMFGGANGLPKEKRDTLAGAVKMAIEAGMLKPEEESRDGIPPKTPKK